MTFCVETKIKQYCKKSFGPLLLLLLCSCTLPAQVIAPASEELPRTEIFGGYENLNISTNFQGSNYSYNLNGWGTSITGYFTDHIGGTAEFSGQYGTFNSAGIDLYTTLFGPAFRTQIKGMGSRPVTVFGRALFGVTAGSASESPGIFAASGTVRMFTMAYGGGLDIGLKKHISLRPVQVDYLYSREPVDTIEIHTTGFRYMPGIVFKF